MPKEFLPVSTAARLRLFQGSHAAKTSHNSTVVVHIVRPNPSSNLIFLRGSVQACVHNKYRYSVDPDIVQKLSHISPDRVQLASTTRLARNRPIENHAAHETRLNRVESCVDAVCFLRYICRLLAPPKRYVTNLSKSMHVLIQKDKPNKSVNKGNETAHVVLQKKSKYTAVGCLE